MRHGGAGVLVARRSTGAAREYPRGPVLAPCGVSAWSMGAVGEY